MGKIKGIAVFILVFSLVIFGLYKAGELLRVKVLTAMGRTDVLEKAAEWTAREKKAAAGARGVSEKAAHVPEGFKLGDEVALYFKDGSSMVGKLLRVTNEEYVIDWKGQETSVFAGQVERLGDPKAALREKAFLSDEEISEWWPFDNDIVVRLTNGAVLDGRITAVGKDAVTLLNLVEGGGSIEQDIDRSRIEHLIFKPVENEKSEEIEGMLKKLFPDMKFHSFGNFTIVSDSDEDWIDECSQVVRNVYTAIYFDFFSLFKERKPQLQNYLVIFDSFNRFVEYAIADGVPGWLVAGYFRPDDKVLYLYNVLGKEFSDILFDAIVGESGKAIDQLVDSAKDRYDDRYHIFIEGEAKGIKDKYWEAYTYYKNLFREQTLSTLRHEFTHQLFANYGLQSIMMSEVETNRERLIEKKKEFLETEDYAKKAEIVKSIISIKKKTDLPEMRAANSWLAEGTATYCETNPPGAIDKQWVFFYQEALKNNALNPIESLTVFRMGSFPGICNQSMLYMYAQSWAFVNFLMANYREEFMEYQKRMAEKSAEGQEDIDWLLECIGKDLRTVEGEFRAYMAKYEEQQDPFLDEFDRMYSIFNRFD